MSTRYFYKNTIADFLRHNEDEIFGVLSRNDEYDTMATQKFACLQEIEILKGVLSPYANEQAWVLFEYTIPRLGKRIDVVVLLRERVFVIEFKAGEEAFLHHDVDQVMDYALDLKNFHKGSADRLIVPILVATESNQHSSIVQLSHYNDGIYEPLMTNSAHLGDIIQMVLSDKIEPAIHEIALADWARSRYEPTPTIIEAARSLYLNHSVEDITLSNEEYYIIRGGGYGLKCLPHTLNSWLTFDEIITVPQTANYFVFGVNSHYETKIYVDDCYVSELIPLNTSE